MNECIKCSYRWLQRGNKKPKTCPRCRNPNWNRKKSKDIIKCLVGNISRKFL